MGLPDKLSRLELQNVAGDTLCNNLKLVLRAYKRPAKRAQVTRRSKDFSATPSTTAFSALLPELNDFKFCCQALTVKNQYISGYVAEVMELWERNVKHTKMDVAAKTTSGGHGKKRVTAAGKRIVALEDQLVESNRAHVRLVDVATHSKASVVKAPADC